MTHHRSALGPSHIFPGAGVAPESALVAQSAAPVDESPTPAPVWSPSMKKADLLAVAAAKGLSLDATATKAEIVSALEAASAR